jgi:predicted NBD/HSP70 family sugar kinase
MLIGAPKLRHVPPLDRHFMPAALWNRSYEQLVAHDLRPTTLKLALERSERDISVFTLQLLSRSVGNDLLTARYLERMFKFLLWQKGARRVYVTETPYWARTLKACYSATGERRFDANFMGEKVYGTNFAVIEVAPGDMPQATEEQALLGRQWRGCRIGFDLGGSARKCAALIDGAVVFSEEVPWDPYFQTSVDYHYQGIQDSLQRAASHLPRVDAIGGSAAGVYVKNEVRVASLFRGIPQTDFASSVRPLFKRLQEDWQGIPFDVINDGEVTALAGAISLNENSVLGISLGTSQAAGFVNQQGKITSWLNELAFAPVDYSNRAHIDEWSRDQGCGVQYLSQQAVARLAPKAGIVFEEDVPLRQRVAAVHQLMQAGDERAQSIYLTVGTYLGYSLAQYHRFYKFKNLLLMGGVTTGIGGEVLLEKASQVLADEFPEISRSIRIVIPEEKLKRHGQAIAAASLPLHYPIP